MNDKIIEAARFCKEANETDCFRCNGNNDNCIAEYSIDDLRQCIITLADRLDSLTAENAEKDKRIAELEAGQKHGKWTVEGCEPGLSYYEHTCTACKEKIARHTGKTLPFCPKCGAKMDGE